MSTTVSPAAAPALPGRRPPWLEFDATDLEFLPAPAAAMIAPVIEPTWQAMVVQARGPVERAVGISMVHLVWIEILVQVGHMDMYRNQDMVLGFPLDPAAISQTLKLIAAKAKLVNACLRLEEFRLKNGRGAFEPDASMVGRTILSVPRCADPGPPLAAPPLVDGQDCPSYGGDVADSPLPGDLRSQQSAGADTRAEPRRPHLGDGQDCPSYGGGDSHVCAARKNAAVGEQSPAPGHENEPNGARGTQHKAGTQRPRPGGQTATFDAPTVVAILERLEALAGRGERAGLHGEIRAPQ